MSSLRLSSVLFSCCCCYPTAYEYHNDGAVLHFDLLIIINCRFSLKKQYSTGFYSPMPDIFFFPTSIYPLFFSFFPAITTPAVWGLSFESFGQLYLLMWHSLLECISTCCSVKATPPLLPTYPDPMFVCDST